MGAPAHNAWGCAWLGGHTRASGARYVRSVSSSSSSWSSRCRGRCAVTPRPLDVGPLLRDGVVGVAVEQGLAFADVAVVETARAAAKGGRAGVARTRLCARAPVVRVGGTALAVGVR